MLFQHFFQEIQKPGYGRIVGAGHPCGADGKPGVDAAQRNVCQGGRIERFIFGGKNGNSQSGLYCELNFFHGIHILDQLRLKMIGTADLQCLFCHKRPHSGVQHEKGL